MTVVNDSCNSELRVRFGRGQPSRHRSVNAIGIAIWPVEKVALRWKMSLSGSRELRMKSVGIGIGSRGVD